MSNLDDLSMPEYDPIKGKVASGSETHGSGAGISDSDSNRDSLSLEDFEKVDADQIRQMDPHGYDNQGKDKSSTFGSGEFDIRSPGAGAKDEYDMESEKGISSDPSTDYDLKNPSSRLTEEATGSTLLEFDIDEKMTSVGKPFDPYSSSGPDLAQEEASLQASLNSDLDLATPRLDTPLETSDLLSSSPGKAFGEPNEAEFGLKDASRPLVESSPPRTPSPDLKHVSPPVMEFIPSNQSLLENRESSPSPREATPSPTPQRESTPPREPTPTPRESTPPPMEPTPSPREPTPPPREPTPPPREPTPPPREPTPPPREPTPPPREPTPPPREPTPPPREPTPPPREPTPPPREPTPPPREPTPPPREPTPPPREPTPPPREPTPPPREPTPPPREPTPPRQPTPPPQEIIMPPVKSASPANQKPIQEPIISEGSASSRRTKASKQLSPSTIKKSLAVFQPCAWFNPDQLDPRVVNLIYWRDVKKSGIVFGSVMVILLSLAYLSLISVVAYTSLTVLTGTIAFRIYKNIMQAVQKSQDGHPFKEYLELDTNLQTEKAHEATDILISQINSAVSELKRLFLVEDLIDSVKFGCLLWCLTYVGSWFNGLTLVILSVVALFSLPKVYEQNQAQIDQYVGLVRTNVNDIMTKVKAAIPIGNKEKAQ